MKKISINNMTKPINTYGRRPSYAFEVHLRSSHKRRLEMIMLTLDYSTYEDFMEFMIDFFFDTHIKLILEWAKKESIEMDMCLPSKNRYEPRAYFSMISEKTLSLQRPRTHKTNNE